MSSHHYRSPEALVRETGSLISLPEVCLRLRAILNDPEHTRRQVTDVIVHDPALTTRLLRIVNSAYFGLSSTVRDISHALAILGEHDLHNLVVVTSLVQGVRSSLSSCFDITAFWKHSVFNAVLSRNLAEALECDAREELFICGLLLDLGKLPLYYREPELYREIARLRRERGGEDWEIERELLGFDHAQVGAELARRWNFPESLAATIAGHHDQGGGNREPGQRIAAVAGLLDDRMDPEDEDFPDRALAGLEDAGIDAALLRQALVHSSQGARQVYEAFFGRHHGT